MNLAKLIKDAVEHYNTETGEDYVGFRDTYSGRGMYGRDCVGITGSWAHCQKVIALAINDAYDNNDSVDATDENFMDFDFRGMVDTLLNFKFDSMGHDVILYWEDVQCEEEEEFLGGSMQSAIYHAAKEEGS
jgi:hypothetical protein